MKSIIVLLIGLSFVFSALAEVKATPTPKSKFRRSLEQTSDDASKAADGAGDQIGETAHQFSEFGSEAASDTGKSIKQLFSDTNANSKSAQKATPQPSSTPKH